MIIENTLFNNGVFALEEYKKFKVVTVVDCCDEDWKTALVHKIEDIPKGTELECSFMINFYGIFLTTKYKGTYYYIDPMKCNYIGRIE